MSLVNLVLHALPRSDFTLQEVDDQAKQRAGLMQLTQLEYSGNHRLTGFMLCDEPVAWVCVRHVMSTQHTICGCGHTQTYL